MTQLPLTPLPDKGLPFEEVDEGVEHTTRGFIGGSPKPLRRTDGPPLSPSQHLLAETIYRCRGGKLW